ncbi:MAG: ABC transporter ATP-binding protein [Erysipelotrichaceae bacterium]|nr:ABC transporter ATP-binding protein [Erysipelotrichaceae bacterium]
MEKNKKKNAFLEILKFYRQIKIPWGWFVISILVSTALKKIEVLVVPWTSKVMTGMITEDNFLIGFLGITLLYSMTEEISELVTDFTGQKISRNVRTTVWNKIIHLPMSFFKKEDQQGLVSRIMNDTQGATGAISCITLLWSTIYAIYLSFVQMYAIYKNLTFVMLSFFPLSVFTAWIMGKLEYHIVNIDLSSLSRITGFFAERLPNINHIRLNNMQDEEYQKGIEENEKRYRAEVKKEKLFIFQAPIGTLAQYINQIILLVVATSMVRLGTMKMYHVVSLYNYSLVFMGNAYLLMATWQIIRHTESSCETLTEICNAPSEDLHSGVVVETVENISFENVGFRYEENTPVLENASFTIPKGKVTCLVGENGCGKSTAIKLIERFLIPQKGRIVLGKEDLSNVSLYDLREQIAYLSQSDQLIHGTILDNLKYGLHRDVTEEELRKACTVAQLDDLLNTEEGWNRQVSRFDNKVSGGEMQRIAIARAYLRNPNYLIMDEATAGIDAVNEKAVLSGLYELMKNKTVIMVTHDMNLIEKADHIVVFHEHTVETSGTVQEVQKKSALFRNFVKGETRSDVAAEV